MSIQSEITRIQGLRNALRAKLVALGLAQSSADLEDCVTAVEAVENRGGVTGSISDKSTPYSVPAGYHNGAGTVSIAQAEQQKLLPGNIKQGVTILGVEGSYSGEGVNLQAKTVTPTKARQTVAADEGYDALSQVTVEPIPDNYGDVSASPPPRQMSWQTRSSWTPAARRRRAPCPTTGRWQPLSTA